jgi:ribosomal protein S27AE
MPRHADVKRYEKYGDGDTPDLCPRCKKGVLADHDDRETCGRCGYSKITKRRQPGEPRQQDQDQNEADEEAANEESAEDDSGDEPDDENSGDE